MKSYLYTFLIFVLACAHLPAAEPSNDVKPVVILGGGVGALTSALYLQRAGIPAIVLEGQNPGGAIAQSPAIHNWPGELEINGQDLIEKIRNQAETNGAALLAKEVIAVDFTKRPFSITMRDVYDNTKIETLQAQACIIATGSKPRLLGIEGENGYWTKGVYSCAVCDGPLYKDKTVAVIGGGDAAIIEADYLSKIAKKVYVIIRSDKFRTVETLRKNALIHRPNVEVLYNTKVAKIEGNGKKVTHLNLSTSNDLDIDGVFVAIGSTPNSDLFQQQLERHESGYIKLIHDQETSVPGVFAIGDVVDPVYKQAISAAGDGAKAALQVEHYLASIESWNTPAEPLVVPCAQTGGNTLEEVTSKETLYSAIGVGSTPLIVDFYSPYCEPCKRLMPILEETAATYQGKARFLKVDVTKFKDLAESYSVFNVPTVLVFSPQGKIIAKGTGKEQIQGILQKLPEMTSK
jgi:thioredoxin reductase (NADPH)